MPTFTSHKPGTFSWIELATTDGDSAKRFYGGLFGWTFDDNPMGPDMVYTMCKLGDQQVAALYKMGPEMKGMPPNWASYITVENVDDTAKKAKANGGKLMKEPFDVMDFGRMAVVQDPAGAVFCLWQPKTHIGVGVKGENGALCYNETLTTNVDAAGKFYASTIGWKTEAVDMGPMGMYTLFQNPGDDKNKNAGGMMPMPPMLKNVPSHWVMYIQVADCDASTKKATELGGKVMNPPTDIPNIGRFSIIQDPQGATFALYKGAH